MRTHIASALLAASSSRQGASVPAIDKVRREMQELGLVGKDGGLTRKGTIQRDRALRAALDKAL